MLIDLKFQHYLINKCMSLKILSQPVHEQQPTGDRGDQRVNDLRTPQFIRLLLQTVGQIWWSLLDGRYNVFKNIKLLQMPLNSTFGITMDSHG